MDMENRVVVLIDMDCFYCQVEEKLNPDLAGKPIAVVQYNPWMGGGYREAGKDVAKVLQKFTTLLERASIDEAYLDITAPVLERLKTADISSVTSDAMPNTFALGYDNLDQFISDVHNYGSDSIDFDHDNAKMLLVGAAIVSEIRAAVYAETGYRCSAGIAHNKILAKLVCGMNKPNKQTVLPKHSVNILYKTLGVKKVKHLGGKFGDAVCEILRITKMAELQRFTEKELQSKFDEKNGTWLYNIARGIDLEPVTARFNPKSIGCCKQFKGKAALVQLESLKKWLKDLGDEIEDRLEKDALENNRTPKQMVVSFSTQLPDGRDTSSSRSYNFTNEDELCGEMFSSKALELVMDSVEGVKPKDGEHDRRLQMPIKFLGISVGKFEDNSESKKTRNIMDFFSAGTSKDTASNKENTKLNSNSKEVKLSKDKKKTDKEYIMQKFFQTTSKPNETVAIQNLDPTVKIKVEKKSPETRPSRPVIETSLDKQESFFAKLLTKGVADTSTKSPIKRLVNESEDLKRATTPVCQVTECGDNSNDTDYSSSTINNEINKSIALFEEDLEDIARVSNMRTLLNSTKEDIITEVDAEKAPLAQIDQPSTSKLRTPSPKNEIETFDCPECRKTIPMISFETHADYHLALKLRDEERKEIRKEREQKSAQAQLVKKNTEVEVKEEPKVETNISIASFFTKFDNTLPMKVCTECGKKILIEKFPEHLDFHEAQKLSRQLNRKPIVNNFASNSVKRKRKSTSPVKKSKMPCKTIDTFFKS
ncbi:DNA polymerase eta isoform X2 [Plutella xylostella]|uniref:DNA polymerase eta isoform X2 n=1 Tax=Plutella xylostella TaxID=51655 RepID=UPI002032F041|nr:DNA polymerase eta isoform X2 [Plutella xylostella]